MTAPDWLFNFILVPVVVYTASFTGWFVTHYGYMRNDYGKGIYNTWRAWWHWHQWAYDFHTTLDTRHPYQSDNPFQWLVQGRPTLFAYTSTPKGPLCQRRAGARRRCSTWATRPSGGRDPRDPRLRVAVARPS